MQAVGERAEPGPSVSVGVVAEDTWTKGSVLLGAAWFRCPCQRWPARGCGVCQTPGTGSLSWVGKLRHKLPVLCRLKKRDGGFSDDSFYRGATIQGGVTLVIPCLYKNEIQGEI